MPTTKQKRLLVFVVLLFPGIEPGLSESDVITNYTKRAKNEFLVSYYSYNFAPGEDRTHDFCVTYVVANVGFIPLLHTGNSISTTL
jgi:hypothetical protein